MNRNIIFYDGLKELIVNNVLSLPPYEIDKMYDSWELDKNKEGIKTNFTYSDEIIHKNQNIPKGVSLKGIDLPTWFGDISKKKVMILGIDPLRNETVFNREKSNPENEVIVGTPYALHEYDSRKGNCAAYWTLIENLSKDNFVYCTDIFKTYYYDKINKKRSYLDKRFNNQGVHRELLISELELVNPDMIIVFGKIAHKLLLNKGCPKISQEISRTKREFEYNGQMTDVYTVIHLGGGAYNSHMLAFLKANELNDINPGDRIACAKGYLKLLT